MIRTITEKEKTFILSSREAPELSVRLQALLSAYGVRQRFFEVWRHNRDSFLLRLEGNFHLVEGPDADHEELAAFLSCSPQFFTLSGESGAVLRVSDHFSPPHNITYSNILCLNNIKDNISALAVEDRPRLRDVYEVLQSVNGEGFDIGAFDPWYVDLSHRIRHGCAQALLLREGKDPACCCLITALSPFAGLIGGVATKPCYRKNGHASALVVFAARQLLSSRRLPVLECTDELMGFYLRLGFALRGRFAVLKNNPFS